MDRTCEKAARLAFRRAEKAAAATVEELISDHHIEVDRHSEGETALAYRPRDMADLHARADAVHENYGVTPKVLEQHELADQGMAGRPFFGALTVPIGFGLNPRKNLAGLVDAAQASGAALFAQSPVSDVSKASAGYRITCPKGSIDADQDIVATNGYSSRSVPDWVGGRYMPSQSNVLVTRP